MAIYAGARLTNSQIIVGQSGYVTITGSDSPANGASWDIKDPTGVVVGSSTTPNGWNMLSSGNTYFVTVPSTATIEPNYELRTYGQQIGPPGGGPTPMSGFFDVVPPAPNPPTNVTATAGDTQVLLSWSPSQYATGYTLSTGPSSTGPWTTQTLSGGSLYSAGNTLYFLDTGLTNGQTYYFYVMASDQSGPSGASSIVNATPAPSIPPAPGALTAKIVGSQVVLSWLPSPGALNGYSVYRSTSSGAESPPGVGSTATGIVTYTDTTVSAGGTFCYVVVAKGTHGTSGSSNEVTVSVPPTPPTNLTATNQPGQVVLNWTAPSGNAAFSYTVWRSTTEGTGYAQLPSPPANPTTATTYTDANVIVGTTYYYVVTASDSGGTSGYSNEAIGIPQAAPPAAPTGLTATPGNGLVGLNWQSPYNSFIVLRKTPTTPWTSIGTSTTLLYSDSAVVDGTSYSYEVEAINITGQAGAPSTAASATPYSQIQLTTTPGNSQVNLNWTAVANVSAYTVYRGPTVIGPFSSLATGVSTNSYADLSVYNGSTYFYVVTATAGGVEGAYSNEASGTPLAPVSDAPSGLTATPGNGLVQIAWTSVQGQTYDVYCGTIATGYIPSFPFGYTKIANGLSSGYQHTGLTNGTAYHYVVVPTGTYDNSHEASATPMNGSPAAPANLQATANSAGYIVLSWQHSLGATSYTIFRTDPNGNLVPLTTALAQPVSSSTDGSGNVSYWCSYVDSQAVSGVTYFYTVSATDQNGTSAACPAVSVAATSLSINQGNTGGPLWQVGENPYAFNTGFAPATNSVIWTPTAGAVSYALTRASSSSQTGPFTSWIAVQTVTGCQFGDTTMPSNMPYCEYEVVATLANGSTVTYPVSQVFQTPPASLGTPTNLIAVPGHNQVYLSWHSVPGANSYVVYKSLNSQGPFYSISGPNGVTNGATSFYDAPTVIGPTTVQDGRTYFYAVQACTGSPSTAPPGVGLSALSQEVSAVPGPSSLAAPTLSATGGTQITLSWNSVGSGVSYEVLQVIGTQYVPVAYGITSTANPITYAITGLPSGTYSYVVMAWNSTGSSPYSNVATATVTGAPGAPTLIAQPGNAEIQLYWSPMPGATSYTLSWSTSLNGPWTSFPPTGGTAYLHTGLQNGTPYFYYVIASNSAGNSAASNFATATPGSNPPPFNLTATPGDTQVTLYWIPPIGATSFSIYESKSLSGPFTNITGTPVPGNTYTVTGLTNGTTYYFYVQVGTSGAQSTIAWATPQTGLPNAPIHLTATGSSAAISLSWTAASGDAVFYVLRSTDPIGPFVTIGSTFGTTYNDGAVYAGTTYYYYVQAQSESGAYSGLSNEASATPSGFSTPISIIPNPPGGYLPDPMTFPDWMEAVEPVDTADSTDGPSAAISVNLAHGVAKVDSGPDLVLFNSYGPSVSFQRIYRTALAAGNLSSPGLPAGWSHNWDYKLIPVTQGQWGNLLLVYPSGAWDVLTPILDTNGNPTGGFTAPAGAPYMVTGIWTPTTGLWTEVDVVQNGLARSRFKMLTGDTVYRLQTQVFGNGSQINLSYDGSFRLSELDNASFGQSLTMQLSLGYVGASLSQIEDTRTGYIRTFSYAGNELASMSGIGGSGTGWNYTYQTLGGQPYILSVGTVDPLSNPTAATIVYDPATGRVASRSDATKNTRSTTYGANIGTVTITNSSGGTVDTFSLGIDNICRTISSTNAANNTTTLTFGNITPAVPSAVTRPAGNNLTLSTDRFGNPLQVLYPFGNTTSYVWQYPTYAPLGVVTSVSEAPAAGSTSPGGTTTYSYTQIQSTGAVVVQSASYPNGDLVQFTYTPMGDISSVQETSSSGTATTTYDYSSGGPEILGHPYSITTPQNEKYQFTYSPTGLITGTTDPLGNQALANYNSYNQLVSTSFPALGLSSSNTFKVSGAAPISSTVTGPGGSRSWNFGYNSQSQLTTTTDPNNAANVSTLDGESDLTNLLNPNQVNMHTFTYTPTALETLETFGVGSNALSVTSFLNNMGNLSTASSSDGRSVSILYQTGDPDIPTDISVTDSITHMDSETSILVSGVDGFGRIQDITQIAPDGLSSIEHQYTYDAEGNLLSDAISPWLIKKTGLIGAVPNPQTIYYQYNADGTRKLMMISLIQSLANYSGGVNCITYCYTYDGDKRITEIDVYPGIAGQPVTSGVPLTWAKYTYDGNGNVSSVKTPNADTFYTYDQLNRVTNVYNVTADGAPDPFPAAGSTYTDPSGGYHTILAAFSGPSGAITYDSFGNRTGMTYMCLTSPSTSFTNSTFVTGGATWTYDNGGRLLTESWTSSLNPTVSLSHQYDPAGNLLMLRGASASVDANSDLLTSLSVPGYSAPTYNKSGEATAFDSLTLSYDPLGELTTILGSVYNSSNGTTPNYTNNFTYDHAGRRTLMSETLHIGQGGVRHGTALPPNLGQTASIFNVWDGNALVYRSFLDTTVTPMVQSDLDDGYDNGVLYLYGPTGPVLEFDRTGMAKAMLFDPNGSCVSTTIGWSNGTSVFAGTTAYPTLYDGYGLPVWQAPAANINFPVINKTTSQPFQYKGQYGYFTDGMTGLIYCIHRYYDPNAGRWTERDPTGLDGGVNVYAYVDGDPLLAIDPEGTQNIYEYDWKQVQRDRDRFLWGICTNIGNTLLSPYYYAKGYVQGGWRNPVAYQGDVLAGGVVDTVSNACLAYQGDVDGASSTFVNVAGLFIPWTEEARALAAKTALRSYVDIATSRATLTNRQLAAVVKRPNLEPAFFGNQVDGLMKDLAGNSKLLRLIGLKTTPRFNFGPDFYFKGGRTWFDVTTEPQWAKHTAKYNDKFGSSGIPLFYKR